MRIRYLQWIIRAAGVYLLVMVFEINVNAVQQKQSESNHSALFTDKARYAPGDVVTLSLQAQDWDAPVSVSVRYYHLGDAIDSASISSSNGDTVQWVWNPPDSDYRGYLASVTGTIGSDTLVQESIAIDVSSDWSKFPRYGFVSKYPCLSQSEIDAVIGNLNRYHINGIQFYDWHYKHHMPLSGSPDSPDSIWNDIANRQIHRETVRKYIATAHEHNMNAMAYNLIYGAWEDAASNGASNAWRLYQDANQNQPWMLDLPSGWASDIYMMDTSNDLWRNYLNNQMDKVFQAFDFDGWHMDQIGDWGQMYTANGEPVQVSATFQPFLESAKSHLDVDLVMNAVNQYGQEGIAASPVDFLYTEVWSPNDSYADLVRIINDNSDYSDDQLNTVLPAYVNYEMSGSPGNFNQPTVLFADAVIFAAGGAHLELGEHMLGHEYFPNDNLQMSASLKHNLLEYYDFSVAYQNLLRDGAEYEPNAVELTGGVDNSSYPQLAKVWTFQKSRGSRDILHFINFVDATTLQWRDNNGQQTEPDTLENIQVEMTVDSSVHRIWIATPDFQEGEPIPVSFDQDGESLAFSLPYLKYWDMVVLEYENVTSTDEFGARPGSPEEYSLEQNRPNPFNPVTRITYSVASPGDVAMNIYNLRGEQVEQSRFYCNAGTHEYFFEGHDLSSGIYFYRFQINDFVDTKRMILLK